MPLTWMAGMMGRAGSTDQPSNALLRQVTVGLLGPLQVSVAGRAVPIVGGRQRALLALLAVAAPAGLSAEELGARIWPGARPQDARRKVQTVVVRLRQQVGSAAIPIRHGRYRLWVEPDQVDARRFGRLVDQAARSDDLVAERALLEAALALWRGVPFDSVDCDWLVDWEAPRLTEQYLAAIERRIDLDLEAGSDGDLVADLRDLTSRHPLRESLWERLLEALDRTGRTAEAVAAYAVISGRLARELNVTPGARLQRIHSRLLEADAARTALVPHQLPSIGRPFVGRTAALESLDAAQIDAGATVNGQPSVVTITGMGGIGKTALALHWAHRVRSRFGDGELYLDLHGYGPTAPMDPSNALTYILQGVGLSTDEVPVDPDARARLLRGRLRGRRTLLILDNVRDDAQVRSIMPALSKMQGPVVLTSRNRLQELTRHAGGTRIELDMFTPIEAVAMLTSELAGQGHVHDDQQLAKVARLCGYLPLALAIAAERVARRSWVSPSDVAGRIGDGQPWLDALTAGDDAMTSVRDAFSWSYQTLDTDAADMFRALGLHPEPEVNLTEAAEIAGIPVRRAAHLIHRLVDANLLERHRYGRFRLHDLLRSYARELDPTIGDASEDGPPTPDVAVAHSNKTDN